MRPSLKTSTATLALVAIAGVGLGACGDKGSDAKSSSTSSRSAPKAAGTGLTQASFVPTLTAAQAKAGTSHVSMDLGVAGQTIKAEGDVKVGASAADTAMSMTMNLGTSGVGTLEMRLVDQTFYLNFGQLTQNTFAKVDLADTSNPLGAQYGQLVDQLDPSKQLAQFAKALTSFDKAGSPETIDGVKAQPYTLVLDTTKIAGLKDLPGAAASAVPSTLTYTMFVGPDNLPRRVVTDAAGTKVVVNYSKWGESVDIAKPSAAQTSDLDLSKLMSGAAGS